MTTNLTTTCGLNDSPTHEHASDCYVPRNEAAERLRDALQPRTVTFPWQEWLDAALAAERRATVERIRAEIMALEPEVQWDANSRPARRYLAIEREEVCRILDKEAAR